MYEDLTREMLLQKIMEIQFYIIDLALFLDTHPNDTKALSLHNESCRKLKDYTDSYQKTFGPLSINYPCNKWRWLEQPWPWESEVC